ncbi:MAG: hypothetical protein PHH54_07045 [Candidatus Nanoarchaeia archaeon]|nr:hypothetical protein [Candidatus Nanoarchaeia archaeon]MDD5741711.1 hypothetical protein [Candidatus Nanoarchaeia archaeon]
MNMPYKNENEALTEIMQNYSLATRSYNPNTFDRDNFTDKRSIVAIMETNWDRCKESMERARQQFGENITPALSDLDRLISKLKNKLF